MAFWAQWDSYATSKLEVYYGNGQASTNIRRTKMENLGSESKRKREKGRILNELEVYHGGGEASTSKTIHKKGTKW